MKPSLQRKIRRKFAQMVVDFILTPEAAKTTRSQPVPDRTGVVFGAEEHSGQISAKFDSVSNPLGRVDGRVVDHPAEGHI